MADLSINTIKSYLTTHQPVLSNKFTVKVDKRIGRLDSIDLSCTNVNLPGYTFSTNPHTGIPGPDVKFPYQVAYEDAILSFMTTGNLTERRYFEGWMDAVSTKPDNSYGYSKFGYRKNYAVSVEISTLDNTGIENYTVTLQNCYPIGLQAVELNHANETIMLTNVTLTYSHFLSN